MAFRLLSSAWWIPVWWVITRTGQNLFARSWGSHSRRRWCCWHHHWPRRQRQHGSQRCLPGLRVRVVGGRLSSTRPLNHPRGEPVRRHQTTTSTGPRTSGPAPGRLPGRGARCPRASVRATSPPARAPPPAVVPPPPARAPPAGRARRAGVTIHHQRRRSRRG